MALLARFSDADGFILGLLIALLLEEDPQGPARHYG